MSEPHPPAGLPVQRLAYRLGEASEAIGCGRTTLWELLRDEKIKAKKMGKTTLILASSLHAFLENLPDATFRGAP